MRLLLVIFAVEALVASWIEILDKKMYYHFYDVEALVASGIEISRLAAVFPSVKRSKPTWLRGLKSTWTWAAM